MRRNIQQIFSRLFSRKKRVRELADAKITLNPEPTFAQNLSEQTKDSYSDIKSTLKTLGWETMSFDRLCSLPPSTLHAIEMQVKKDKFNVPDSQFQQFGQEILGKSSQDQLSLNPYYQKVRALILNQHAEYDLFQPENRPVSKYLGELYVYDLRLDKSLQAILTFFINNLKFPNRLEALAEPTLVKKLLSFKRELMMQGVKFQTHQQVKQIKKQHKKAKNQHEKVTKRHQQLSQILDEEEEIQGAQEEFEGDLLMDEIEKQVKINNRLNKIMEEMSKYSNQVAIVKVLGYQYEFWVDVKHNRGKNGQIGDYVIEEREIDHPNTTILLTSRHPKIKVKYIVHKRKRKEHDMHFCTKADLLIKINGKHQRRVKVEWSGPSNKQATEEDFIVIDYEHIMNGNPTIKSVFTF